MKSFYLSHEYSHNIEKNYFTVKLLLKSKETIDRLLTFYYILE